MKKILIAAGGTGGHFYPGFSLAKSLRQKGWEAIFLLRTNDPARKFLDEEGFPSVEIPLRGMPRSLRGWWSFASGLFESLRISLNIVSDFKPDIVMGMGGYLSFPAVLAATLKRKPRLVHESNVLIGLSNRACVILGAKFLRGLPGPGGILTGTPIRPSLAQTLDPAQAKKALGFDPKIPLILIFGGSQGARGINAQVPTVLKTLASQFPRRFQVLHLCGKEIDAVKNAYQGANIHVEVKAYFEEMDKAYGACDLVISRAGASTIAELCAQKKPAILIPYPNAAANHQLENAKVIENARAGIILLEENISSKLLSLIQDILFSQGDRTLIIKEGYSRIPVPTPSQVEKNLVEMIEHIIRNKV